MRLVGKTSAYTLSALILGSSLLGSCTYSSSSNYMGTMAGAEIGGVIGEAFGLMATHRHEGPGKAMLGLVLGTAAGAAIGNAVTKDGTATGKSYHRDTYSDYQTGGGYDSSSSYSSYGYATTPSCLSIHNVTYQDENGDGRFSRNETINITYEIKNHGNTDLSDVVLMVEPVNAKNIAVSPFTTVNIKAGETLRYKAKAFCKSYPTTNTTIFTVGASSTYGKAQTQLEVRMAKK